MTCTATRHGTSWAWQSERCTCPGAREAYNQRAMVSRKARQLGRPGLVDGAPAHRMVRTLMASGWPASEIARRIGWRCGELDAMFRRPRMYRRTADKVQAVYDELHAVPGPNEITRRRAARADWWLPLPPEQEVCIDCNTDQVAVDRFLNGDSAIRLTREERYDAWCRLLHRGTSRNEAARRLGLSGQMQKVYADRMRGERTEVAG